MTMGYSIRFDILTAFLEYPFKLIAKINKNTKVVMVNLSVTSENKISKKKEQKTPIVN